MITSTSNQKIKKIIALKEKSKLRKEEGVFICEGIKMFSEVPLKLLVDVYVSKSFIEQKENKEMLLEQLGEDYNDYEIVDDKVFKVMSDTVTPQGILCTVKMPVYSLDEVLKEGKTEEKATYILLEDLRDPGNLGTILRTAEAAGVKAVIMSKETADIFNPKVIRSTMGSVFRVPFVYVENLKEAVEKMKDMDFSIFATSLKAEKYLGEIKFPSHLGFLIGNEAKGLSDEICGAASDLFKIPMEGKVESLNAAVSAAIVMYFSKMA